MVAVIKPLVAQISQLDRQIASALREHPDGEIFTSLFKDPGSVICAAGLLSEIGWTAAHATQPVMHSRVTRPSRGQWR